MTGKDSLLLCDGVLCATLTANGKLRAVGPHSGVKGTARWWWAGRALALG